MARRRKDSFVEDVIAIAAKLPWPVGVTLAPIAFFAFRTLAGIEVPASAQPGELGSLVVRQFIKIGAAIFQWVIPILLLVGSSIFAIQQRRRVKLFGDVVTADSPAVLNQMSWRDFERLVADYFRRRGFDIKAIGGGRPDGGVDLIVYRGTDEYVVQCKQWKALRVGVVPVRELYGVVAARRAVGGFMVTSGSFTDEAIRFAAGISIELIDGAELASAISRQGRLQSGVVAAGVDDELAPRVAPRCPKCQAEMVLRTARTGQNAGSQFWGCARFPGCRGSRPTN
jgi:restriction system protein